MASVPIGTNISAVGNELTFMMQDPNIAPWRPPFKVKVVRYDAAAYTIAVETLPGHPLVGWRYFRVFQHTPGKLVLETGAMDDAAPGFVNLVGFYAARYGTGGMTEVWRQHFENVLANMATSISGASRGTDPPYDLSLTAGKWDWNKQYIMTHVCGAVPAPAGLCP